MTELLGAALLATAFQAAPCESLTSFSLENGSIATADMVPEGPFVRPAGGRGGRGGRGEPGAPARTLPLDDGADSDLGLQHQR